MYKKIELFNEFHLGDNVFTIHYLNKYADSEILFNYYINENYIYELKKHIKNTNITLYPLNERPINSYNMWIGHNNFYFKMINYYNFKFDLFYVDFFKMTSQILGLESKINSNYDLLFDNSNFEVFLGKSYDYLIINSIPFSNQFDYNENDFIKLCQHMEMNGKSFITTKKIDGFECTLDYNMSLIDIGNLSNYCENIIAINTSPIITTFTTENINKTNNRFILDKWLSYSYNNRIYNLTNLSYIYDKI